MKTRRKTLWAQRVQSAGIRRGTAGGIRSVSGFTLVEIVFALLLLAVVMAGVYRTLNTAIRLRATAHRHYLGVIIANNRIERAKTIGFSELPFMAETRVRVNEQGTPTPDGLFLRTTNIAMNHDGNPRLAHMIVTVDLPPLRSGASRASESVSILLTEYVEP